MERPERSRPPDALRAAALRSGVLRQLAAVAGVYLASRVYTTLLLAFGLWLVTVNGWHQPWLTDTPTFVHTVDGWLPHAPTLSGISAMWDGWHYQMIAAQGYPSVLPRDAAGAVAPNSWAFLPGYPMLVAALQLILGTGFASTGVWVSLVFGGAATLMLYLVVRERAGAVPAWVAASVFAFGPLAFVLQLAYAESLFLFLVFAALYLMQRGRYLSMLVPAVLAAFTRPGEIALALALAVVFVVRLRAARWGRDTDAFTVRERVALLFAGGVTAVAGVAWPLIAWAVTGVSNAYTATELSWRVGFLGHTDFRPFTGWFELGGRYLGAFGVVLIIAVIAGFVWWLSSRGIRSLGVEVWAVCAAFALYLIAVFMPQQSVFRVAMPLAPMMGDTAIASRPRWRRTVFVLAALAQPVCIAVLWFYANP